MLLFLAALQGIPQDVREASVLDGTNDWQYARLIQIPIELFSYNLAGQFAEVCGAKSSPKVAGKRGRKFAYRKCIKGRQFRPFVPHLGPSCRRLCGRQKGSFR